MVRERGPGPKYMLPSTFGCTNPDPTRQKAPSYSFGSRYSSSDERNTTYAGPGPYYLESGMSNKGRVNNAGFTLHGRPKRSMFEIAAASSPGPAYSVNDSMTQKRTPAFSFGSPHKSTYKSDGPGPNSYPASSDWEKNTKGAIIGSRSSGSKGYAYDYTKAPGPGHYGNPYENQSRGPAFTIGQRYKGPSAKFVTPGPNSYNVSHGLYNTSPSSPRFSMGVRHHEEVITMADVSD